MKFLEFLGMVQEANDYILVVIQLYHDLGVYTGEIQGQDTSPWYIIFHLELLTYVNLTEITLSIWLPHEWP